MIVAYFAFENFVNELIAELGVKCVVHGRLVIIEEVAPRRPMWAQNIWLNPVYLPINSITDAVRQLRHLQLRWVNYALHYHRRSELIQQQLPALKFPLLEFLAPLPERMLGSWTLINENLMLASPHCVSHFPNGEIHFHENKIDPPSRAYLKLWELFTIQGIKPAAGDLCVDLGSSPGGWTWVLEQLQCRVISIDKAPLAPKLLNSPQVRYLNRSAFAVSPQEIGPIDWLFSDVICYPQRLLKLIDNWLQSGFCANFVCTIKLQGETDFTILQEFLKIPESRLIHLYHNKHELTWVRLKKEYDYE